MQQLDFFEVLDKTQTNCIACGKHFKKKNINHKYCSNNCRVFFCNKMYHKNNYEKRTKHVQKIYREKNKEKIAKRHSNYYLKNRDNIVNKQKKYRETNLGYLEYVKKYNEKNKKKRKILRITYAKILADKSSDENLKKKVINYRITQNLRTRLIAVIKNKNAKKSNKTMTLLGCSLEFFKKYIEKQFKKGMTWENHSQYGWHLDHIKPCSSFDLTDPEQQKICFHYTNFQPLWWRDNLTKGSKVL